MSQGYGAITGYAASETERFLDDVEVEANNDNDINNNNGNHLLLTNTNTAYVEEQQTQEVPKPGLVQQLIAECIGTCMLTQIGCAGLCASTYLGVYDGLWQAAVIWLLGAMLAISVTASISGAHLNPAVSVSDFFICKNYF